MPLESGIYFFSGRIHPERANVGEVRQRFILRGAEGIEAEAQVDMGASQVFVRIDGDTGTDIWTLKNRVGHLVQTICDAMTWGNGCAYRVEIVGVVTDKDYQVFGVDHPVATRATEEATPAMKRALTLTFGEDASIARQFKRALADYRQSILEPDDTPELCWRAVEALSYTFHRNNRTGINELARQLRIDRDWILRNLERPAGDLRHGKVRDVPGDERTRSLRCAQIVIERFLLLHESPNGILGDDVLMIEED